MITDRGDTIPPFPLHYREDIEMNPYQETGLMIMISIFLPLLLPFLLLPFIPPED